MLIATTIAGIARRVPFYRGMRRRIEIERLRKRIAAGNPLNVVIGGGETAYESWIGTDRDFLDITNPADWRTLFRANSIHRLLCEHVLEHLTEAQAATAVRECHRFLQPGGLFRIAVPDGFRRDAIYVAEAAPPNDGHQVFYNVRSLTALLTSAGFSVTPLEYFDEAEEFHAAPWDEREGMIIRSARFDQQQKFRRGDLYYTSLIVDARKN